jgi:KDO2-lipid IV(A) lauroyltransferase
MAFFKRTGKRFKNKAIYIFIRTAITFVMKMERGTAIKFFETFGKLGYYLAASERKKTIKHLTMVFGNQDPDIRIEQMAKDVFLNLARNMVDAIRLQKYDAKSIDSLVSAKGLGKIDRALENGRGLLLLTGHLGNWELLGAYLAFKGYPLHVVGAPIYDPRLDELIIRNRQHSGARYIARGASASKKILRALRSNEILGLLIDQDSKKFEGVFVDFMGKEAYTPVGPVLLAMKTNAVLMPITIHMREDYHHVIDVGDEIELEVTGDKNHDLLVNTQRCSKAIEKIIFQQPTQWVWMHDRWKTKKKIDSKG